MVFERTELKRNWIAFVSLWSTVEEIIQFYFLSMSHLFYALQTILDVFIKDEGK